ncbi:UDP-glycosyltransferase 73C3-like [Cicer arietinum]|uniref:Glycosyltransferase n=1 Tax=Cicer arietinum TaxID=3827 RepID=A0A1S2Y103_CICAR|nr:UDP-glycosyltransferase 73C3-like [Cicer arietinum]
MDSQTHKRKMDSQTHKNLHFVLFPLMSQGHMIPMMDIAKILSKQNITVTIITTPQNASRFTQTFSRSKIRLVELQFPSKELNLPKGCENLDMLSSLSSSLSFFNAANSTFLQDPVEKIFEKLTPLPSCIISDMCLHYTSNIATKFNVPRISFLGQSCFTLFCLYNLGIHRNVLKNITDENEKFFLPGIVDKIEMTKAMIPRKGNEKDENWKDFYAKTAAAESVSYGVVMNSFEELEMEYAKGYKRVKNGKVWCIGPVSLSNKDDLDKGDRGKKSSIDEHFCMKWLDLNESKSVIYVCLGSICNLTTLQLIELGLGLEACNRPFIWVIREGNLLEELENWIKGFEERVKSRSIVIRGWAPQVLILSHPSIGAFLTHCGWNSTLEAICDGVPMITWPLFGDQFFNERLVVKILKIGVSVGVEGPMKWGEEEELGLMVKKDDVVRGIEELMNESSESDEMRRRVEELGVMAKIAIEEGGSSYFNVNLLIQDILQQSKNSK